MDLIRNLTNFNQLHASLSLKPAGKSPRRTSTRLTLSIYLGILRSPTNTPSLESFAALEAIHSDTAQQRDTQPSNSYPFSISATQRHCNTCKPPSILKELRRLATNIITRAGHEKLKGELDHLWRVYRPEITQKVAWAASLGDRSENADYQYNKKLLREIDRRVRYLRKRLEDVKVVEYSPEQEGKVFFGAWVEVENDDGEQKTFRVVGYDEIYERNDYISIDSPMARALLKKQAGDECLVKIPDGEAIWYINKITYEHQ